MIRKTDVDPLFQGVGNDDQYTEAQVKRDLWDEKEKLENELRIIKIKLGDWEEKVKKEKASRQFISKADFLMREQLDRMENLIVKIDDCMLEGDKAGIEKALNGELVNIWQMNIYLASSKESETDILYDFKRSNVYKKIKENNADYTRTNKELRKIEVRKTEWIPFQRSKSGDSSSGNY